jgi:hypothetical protein
MKLGSPLTAYPHAWQHGSLTSRPAAAGRLCHVVAMAVL